MDLNNFTGYFIKNNFITKLNIVSNKFLRSVIILSCEYTLKCYHDSLFEKFNIACPNNICNAVPKRKSEYLAGRYLSRILLLAHGLPPTNILSGIHRQPLWPMGWTGSITHTNNTAVSCLANLSQTSVLGIDLENWMELDTAQKISERILDEQELILLFPLKTFQRKVTLAFSAKESFFKAIYQKVGYYFDFDVVRLVNFKINNSSFILQLKKTLSCSAKEGDLFFGYFNMNNENVLTFIIKHTCHDNYELGKGV